MDQLTRAFTPTARIDLAREPEFRLGGLAVRPARREVQADGVRRTLQPRVMQVLVALSDSPSEVVSQQELIHRCWGGLSVSDDAIGRCIAQLRRLAESLPVRPFRIETIAGVGYRLERAATPEAGVGASSEAAAPVRKRQSRRLVLAFGAAVGAIVLAAVGFLSLSARGSGAVSYPTVAVGAFQPADASRNVADAAATLQNDIADSLSRYDLTVVKTSSPLAAARALFAPAPADFVLDGRIATQPGSATVTSELVDARSGVVVYSFDTTQPTPDNATLAALIARHVALSLDPSKFTNDLGGKLSAADYTLVARGNEAIDHWDPPVFLAQSRALAARHPDDADLQAAVAIGAVYTARDAPDAPREQLVRDARQSLATAARLSSTSALLYIAQGQLLNGPNSYADEERLMRKAISLNPNQHVAYNGLGEVLLTVGRTREGVAEIRRSVQLDPMSLIVVDDAAMEFALAGDAPDEADAVARLQQGWGLGPQLEGAQFLQTIYLEDSRGVPALDRLYAKTDQSAGLPPGHRNLIVEAVLTRDPQLVRRMVANCASDFGKNPYIDGICLFDMVRLGALDDAFRFAALALPDERSLPENADAWITKPPPGIETTLLFSPRMKAFRDDARFWDVAVRTGLAAYWQASGAWPDFCQPQLESCKRLAAAALLQDQRSGLPARETHERPSAR